MGYQIDDLQDLAKAFRDMAEQERKSWVGEAKFRQREREARAKAYETCATMVEQTRMVKG